MSEAPSADLTHVETWLFDLDNTLYPAECEYMALIEGKMTDFMERTTGLPRDEARAIQKKYYHEHGTTLAGLMANHGIEALGAMPWLAISPARVVPCSW